MLRNITRCLAAALAILLALPALGVSPAGAQGNARTFPETGKTVSGRFLQYWDTHGGLAQQGYPISSEMPEKSDTDGKVYTVQYFERAVFELHAENQAPNDVLLSLLGSFLYTQKYPGGAPGQKVSAVPGAVLFKETGHTVGGKFLNYWKAHGGLAQQGYPLSEEFQEKSDLDGKTYTVQYFERAVFELHPEKQPPYDLLLSQLGTFRYSARYGPDTMSGNCSSPIRPGIWAGPMQSTFTMTLPSQGLTGSGAINGTMRLNVRCNSTFTGIATGMSFTTQVSSGRVPVTACTATKTPVLNFVGRVVQKPEGLRLVVDGGRWAQGIMSCTGLTRQTQDLTGQQLDPAEIKVESATADHLSGSDWLGDLISKTMQNQIAAVMPGATVEVQTSGHWELSYQPGNTP